MSTAALRPAFGARSHWTLFLLLMVYTLSFTHQQIISILVEPIKEEFHVSDAAMGMLAGLAFAPFYGVLAIPAGRYADHANRRNLNAVCWSIESITGSTRAAIFLLTSVPSTWTYPAAVGLCTLDAPIQHRGPAI